jgi:hypothetical protein
LKAYFVILAGFVALAACSKPPPPRHFGQLKVNYKKLNGQLVQRQIPIVSALVDYNTAYKLDSINSSHPYRYHQFCFANYGLSAETVEAHKEALKDVPPGQDMDPLEICINVNDQEGTDQTAPFKPGTYFIGITQDQPDRVSAVFIYLDQGKNNYVPFTLSSMTGSLRLDSVSDDLIAGEMNLSDGDNSIAGTFNLKPKIRKWVTLPTK